MELIEIRRLWQPYLPLDWQLWQKSLFGLKAELQVHGRLKQCERNVCRH